MKRLISLLLVAVALPLIGDTYTDPFAGYTWTYSIHGSRGDRKAWISSFKFTPTSISTPLTGAVTIPVKLGGAVVVCIESYAFGNCSNLTSVTIPNSVVSIGASAFSGCSGLTSVTIPDSVTSIGWNAFYNCSGLTSVTIPDSVTSIGGRAFQNCSGLASVTIGSGVKSIGDLAFYGCSGLTLITVDSNNQAYKSANGLLFTKDGTTLIQGTSGNVTIPDSVTSIGDHAFEYCCGLTSIEMPDSVTNIGKYAFRYCSGLTSIEMPDSVMSIGDSAVCYCSNLTSVTIGNSVTSIGGLAFKGCSGLTSLTIPDGVTSIGEWAFSDCSGLTAVHITDLAAWCRIRFSYGSNPLIRARNLYLNGALIKDLTIPSSITSIGNYAFHNCRGLTSVAMPNSITSIGDYAFYYCSGLTSIEIPDSVTNIGASAFENCTNLISVTIPNGVTSVGMNAFAGCKSVHQAVVPGWRCEIPFEDVADLEISDGTTRIGEHAFSGCSNLVSIIVPDSVTNICEDAFKDCISLRRIILPVSFRDALDVPSVFGNGDNNFEILYLDSLCVLLNTPHLNFSRLKFSAPSNCFWSSDFAISHDGVSSARLKGMGQDSESSIELQLDSPGRLSFWWKASSESDGNNVFDYACLSIDGVPQGTLNKESYRLNGVAIGGKTEWRQEVIDVVGKGSHVIRWTYAKDKVDEGDIGEDCAWLDQVTFTPLAYLSFDIAGGSGTAPAEISELEGTVVTLPAQSGFEWEDHVFNGWSDGKATYAAESQYVVPASNVTFTAQWIAKRFLTFALDGGVGRIPVTIKDVPGADITLPSANGISRAKHVFVGWSDGSATHDAGSKYRVTDASVEFKAVWQRKEAHVSIVSDDVVNGGTVDTAGATISMSACSNPSVGTPAIYYTLDGTEPTTGSTRYEGPFFVGTLGDVTVRAFAVLDDCFDGEATFSFTRLPYSLSECVAMEGVNVAVGGATPWFRVTGEGAHDGKAAMRSGVIGDGENSYVEMQVRGEVEVSFWWKISSQNKVRADKHDYLAFSVDGEEALTLGGGVIDWTNATYAVTGSGRHSLRWTYIKDGADASNEDCAWLDDVVWSPTGKLCAVSFDANGGEVSECERKVREGSSVGDLPVPNRSEHIFEGWFTEAEGGLEVSAASEITDDITYYAHWKDGHFIITFDANGGTGGLSRTMVYGEPLSAPTVTRTGYTFVGWSQEVGTTVPASNVVYTAQWSVNQYTATFDANGGSGGKAVMQNYGTELAAPTVTRTGYSFAGWRPSVPTTMPAADRTFVAQWKANIYTVTFDPDGGVGGWSRQMEYGTEIAAPTPTREGYVFNYWLRGRRGDGYTIWYRPPIEADGKITVTDNVTYYAQWTKNIYTVTFDPNGGMGETGALSDGLWAYYPLDGNVNDTSGNDHDLTEVENDPQPTTDRFGNANGAYVFNGNSAQRMDIHAENDAEVQSSAVIGTFSFAFWFQTNSSYKDYGAGWAWNLGNYAVFPSHGGYYADERGQASGLGVKVGVDGIELVEHADFYMPTKLTYNADIGNGWHHVAVTVEDSGCPILYLDGAYVATGETSDRTRVFRPNVGGWQWGYYTGKVDDLVVYNRALSAAEVKALYDGVGEVKMEREYDEDLGALPTPTRTGYTFDGWYTAADGGEKIDASIRVAGDTTYYAHWIANTYKVAFDKNGGTGGTASVKAAYGQPMPKCTPPSKAGYAFDGYWTTTGAGGVKYYNADGTSAHTWDKASATTLLAMWVTPTVSKVTFGKNGGTGGDDYVICTEGQPMPTPCTPPKLSGYTFGGYFDTLSVDEKGNAKGKKYYDADMKSVRNWDKKSATTLWAKWTNKVTFGKNGGTGGDNYVTCTKGQPMPKRTMPTKTGYTFAGYWTTTGAGGVKYYNADGTSARKWDRSGNVKLWAKWEMTAPVKAKVTFGKNGGSGGDIYVTATYGKAMPMPRTAPKRTGWTFAGYWDTLAQDANGSPKGKQYYDANMKSVRNWDKTSDVKLWAKWTVRVKLGKNGGTGGDNYVTVTYNQPFPKRTMPKKAGYKFGGYYVSASKGTGQCYNADGTGTASMKWSTGGSPTIWALWINTSSLVEFAPPSAAPVAAELTAAFPAGLYSGVLADGSGAFWLMLDEPEEGQERTAYLYVASEDGVFAAECAVEEAGGVLILTTEDGESFAFDLVVGTLVSEAG